MRAQTTALVYLGASDLAKAIAISIGFRVYQQRHPFMFPGVPQVSSTNDRNSKHPVAPR